MKKFLFTLALLFLFPHLVHAQSSRNPCYYNSVNPPGCIPVSVPNPLPVNPIAGVTQIQGSAAGTTGAVVGTLAATSTTTTYLCDFDVTALGSGSVGPITVAGLLGGSKVYQLTAGGTIPLSKSFNPCLPASAVNTAITITTTADATATAVDVNSSGYQK